MADKYDKPHKDVLELAMEASELLAQTKMPECQGADVEKRLKSFFKRSHLASLVTDMIARTLAQKAVVNGEMILEEASGTNNLLTQHGNLMSELSEGTDEPDDPIHDLIKRSEELFKRLSQYETSIWVDLGVPTKH